MAEEEVTMNLLKIAARVAQVRTAVPGSMKQIEIGMTPQGPWNPTTPEQASAAIEAAYSASHQGEEQDDSGYAEPTNGVILYLKVGETLYAVSDVSSIHGDDAMSKFDILTVDEDGAGDAQQGDGSFDDPLPVLQDIVDGGGGEDPGPPSDPGPNYDTLEEKRGEK
jgi:hypothetical protein